MFPDRSVTYLRSSTSVKTVMPRTTAGITGQYRRQTSWDGYGRSTTATIRPRSGRSRRFRASAGVDLAWYPDEEIAAPRTAQPGHQPDGAAGVSAGLEFRVAAPQVMAYTLI
jgi:hypothetical protein